MMNSELQEERNLNTRNIIQEKSYKFALEIIKLVQQFPRTTVGFVIGNQLLKAGTSVGANIEEAIGGFSKEDFTYKMSIAQKEARESHYWLRLTRDSKIITNTDVGSLIMEAEELVKILTSIVKTSQKHS